MLRRAFAVTCDASYFAGLKALLNSIHAYHGAGIPVFIYERGFGRGEFRWLEAHPLQTTIFRISELPYFSPGLWEAKQQIFSHCVGRARCVFLLDVDLVITSDMDDVWALAESGRIVAGHDGGQLRYDGRYRAYHPDLPGQEAAHLNTGAVCLDVERHWDLAGLWAFSANFGEYSPHRGFPLHLPGRGDQGLFNAIATMLGKRDDIHLLPYLLWHECGAECPVQLRGETPDGRLEVWNLTAAGRQRILHAAGSVKWWTESGARHQERFGDKLRCFQHFEHLRPHGKSSFLSTPERIEPAGWADYSTAPGLKILIAVCSCHHFGERRAAVRETWFKTLPPGVAAFFFVGEGRGIQEPDVAVLPASDTYDALPEKVHALFQYVLDHYEFDYLFKCDDDTYVRAGQLRSLLTPGVDFVGDERLAHDRLAQGGAGYLLSRSCVEKLARLGLPFHGPEDLHVSRVVLKLGVKSASTPRLRHGHERLPDPSNDVVTAHRCGPDLLCRVHRQLWDAPPVLHAFAAKHASWTGSIELLGDGTFRGGASKPGGLWELSADAEELALRWDHWPEDRLKRTAAGFASGRLQLTRKSAPALAAVE